MRINNNIPALNTHRLLNSNTNKLSKSLERLSSGKRINRAADDAAGLAISQKMTAQVRGLRQASRNSLDGISLVQTAEGALNEMNEMLQRIRELAVQAANGSYQNDDRLAIQNEITQLIEELDSISNQTQFNGIYLLNGNSAVKDQIGPSNALEEILGSGKITITGGLNDKYEFSGTKYASAIIDFSNLTSSEAILKLAGQGVHYTCCTCNKAYSIRFVTGEPDTSHLNSGNPIMEVNISGITNGEELAKKINKTAYGKEFVYIPTSGESNTPNEGQAGQPNVIPSGATSFVNHYSQIAVSGSKLYIYDIRSSKSDETWPSSGRGIFKLTVYTGEEEIEEESNKVLLLDIQVGANEGEKITIEIPNVDPEHLEIKDQLSVLTQKDANLAISQADRAITRILQTRSRLGAYQNRLEHTIANVDNTAENLQESVSRIADLDMALEMSQFTKLDILQQASTSMLSQANNLPQSVLRLLQS